MYIKIIRPLLFVSLSRENQRNLHRFQHYLTVAGIPVHFCNKFQFDIF